MSGPAHPVQLTPDSSQSGARVQVTGEACADRWWLDLENLENPFFPPGLQRLTDDRYHLESGGSGGK